MIISNDTWPQVIQAAALASGKYMCDLAEETGIDIKTLRSWRQGKRMPRFRAMLSLLESCCCYVQAGDFTVNCDNIPEFIQYLYPDVPGSDYIALYGIEKPRIKRWERTGEVSTKLLLDSMKHMGVTMEVHGW